MELGIVVGIVVGIQLTVTELGAYVGIVGVIKIVGIFDDGTISIQ
jgi:hypothetical protein